MDIVPQTRPNERSNRSDEELLVELVATVSCGCAYIHRRDTMLIASPVHQGVFNREEDLSTGSRLLCVHVVVGIESCKPPRKVPSSKMHSLPRGARRKYNISLLVVLQG